MSRFSDMVNAMRNNYGSSGNTAQPVNNVQVNYANQQAMIQRQEQARIREEERRRRLEEERRKREEERKRKEEERKAEEQRQKEQANIRAEEARAKAQKALEKSKENNFQQVQQPKQQVQQRSEETSASNARRLAQKSLGDNKQSVQRELANRALESSKSLEKSEQSIRRLEEKRNKEVQDNLDFSYAQKQNQEREKYRKEIENRVGIGREINAKKGWEEQARKNGYTDDDIQTAYYAWLSDVDNELSTIPDFMSREATVNRIMNGKNVSLSGSYDLNDPTAYLPKKKDGTFLHDSAVNIEDTVDNLRSGLQQWNANTGRGIANLVEAVNPESNYKENYDEQLINSGYYDRLQQLNNNDMAGTFLGRVAQGVGANVPNAILGGLTGLSGASLGMAGLGAYGGSSQNALERGLDTQKATEYGLLNAGVELGTELLNPISDYIPMVGQSMGLKDILGEGFEEVESALVEPLLESSYFGGNPMDEYASGDYWRNVAEQGLLGSTIALASNPTGAINGVRADIDNRLVNDLNNVVNDAIATEQARTPLETPEQLDLFSGEEVPTMENFVQRPQQPNLPSSFFEALQESVNNDTPLLGFDEVNYALNQARDSGVVFNNNDEQRQFITRQFIENQMQEQLADTELADDPIIQDFIEEQTDEATERIMNVTRGAKNLAEGKGAGSNETVTRDTQSIYEQKIAQEMGDVMYETIKETGDDGIFSKSMREVEESGVEEALNKFKNNLNTAITGDGIFDTLWKMRKGELLTNKKLVKQVSDGFAIRETLERQKQDIIRDLQAKGYAVRENTVEGDIRATIYGNGQQLNTKEANDYAKRLNAINSELADVNYVMHTISHNAGLILGEYSRLDALTPSKQRQAIEDVVARLNAELHKKFHKQFQNGKLTDIEVNPELMEQFRNAETQDERNAIAEQIQEDIASQIPASMGEKIRAIRYLNMLGNPVTWIRNGLGNTLEQGMYKTRDIAGVLIEKYLDSRGHVRYDRLNRSNAYDKALIQYAQDHVLETLENDYAEWKKVGGNKRAFFKSKGYSGALLNKLVGWQGSTFNLNGDEVGLEKIVNAVANNLKANNATVTDDGLLGGVNFNQIVRDGYNQAKKQYIDSSELRFRRAKNATDGNQIEQASKIFDTLRGDFKTVGNKYTSNGDIDARSFEGGIRARAQENIFGDSTLGKVVNSANNLTNYVLNDSIIGDTAFTKYRYARTLAQALNAQGIDIKSVGENGVTLVRDGVELSKGETQALLETLDAQAFQDARESVYRDFSAVARAINQLADSNGLANIIIGGNIPFTTTPINIVKRAVEFSPAGLLYTVHKQSKMLERGEITPSTFINNLAKGMSGTAFSAMGALLARMGMIRARGDKKDEKEHKYEVNNGLQDYSLVLPNGDTYSLESMAPASTVLMYGAWVYELLKRNNFDIFDTGNDFMKNWDGILTPLLDMTMLSGLKDTLNSFGEDSFKGILLKTLENYVGQFTPTLGAKINKVFDDTTRSTWSDNLLERMFRNFVNKIPFADATWALMTGDHYLKPSLNNRGEEIKNVGGNALGRLAYNFLSPGTYKENTMNQNMTDASFTNVDDELLRLYESKEVDASKKQYLLPYKVYSFNVDGEKMNLTAQEKDEYNKEYLQNVRKQVEAIMSSPLYQNMTDSERANLITGVQNYYYNKIKQNYFDKVAPGGYNLSGANQAIEGLTDIGVEPYQVLYYKSITNMKDKDGNTINNSGALQVREAMESAGVYDDILNAYRTGKFDNLNSVGLNNKVAKMSDSEYMYNKELLDNGLLGATQSKTNEEKRESFNSAYEENQALEKKYSDIGVNTQSIYRTNDVKSKYDDNGKAITYSQDLLAREAMGEDFGKLIEAVQDGRISIDEAIKDTGIGKTVFMMSEDEFQKDLGYLNDGTWTNATYNKLMNKKATWGTYKNYSGKSSNTSNTSKSSGGYSKSRKRSSGGTSSRVSNKVKSVSSSSKSTKAKASELSTYMKTVLKEQEKGAKSTGNAVKKSMENAIKNLRKSDQELYNEIMSSHNKNVEALRKELGLKKQ